MVELQRFHPDRGHPARAERRGRRRTRHPRNAGAGFCCNIGRVLAAVRPFAVGTIAAQGTDTVLQTLFYVGLVPALGLFLLPWVVEPRDKALAD